MLRILIHNWRLLALRGGLALAFAMFAFSLRVTPFSPLVGAITFAFAVMVFGAFAFSAGIVTIIAGLRGSAHGSERWLLLVDGCGASIFGLALVLIPDLTLFHLIQILAWWAVFIGALESIIALRLRRHIGDEWFLLLSSVGSILFGAYLLSGLVQDELGVLKWVGLYSAYSGITLLVLAFRLRGLQLQAHRAAAAGQA